MEFRRSRIDQTPGGHGPSPSQSPQPGAGPARRGGGQPSLLALGQVLIQVLPMWPDGLDKGSTDQPVRERMRERCPIHVTTAL